LVDERQVARPVGAHDQHPAAGQPPPQVEQQAGRAGIRPLQVVQHQDQGVLTGQGLQDPGDLLKQVRLMEGDLVSLLFDWPLFDQFLQPGPPGGSPGGEHLGAQGQGCLRQQEVYQVGAIVHQRAHRVG
jgi:hypothetical protein